MNPFTYRARKLNQISFPLGGIGTGCIGLAGDGRLVDWEIYNRSSKMTLNGFSHFAIKAERAGKVLDARILNGDLQPPYMGGWSRSLYNGIGFGPPRETLAGLPHFRETEFTGTFPIARVCFKERKFPGAVALTAFNPLIPGNDTDSSIPAAFFTFGVTNPTDETLRYTIAAVLADPLPEHNIHHVNKTGGVSLLHMTSTGVKEGDLRHGDLTIATDAPRVSFQQYWFKGGWCDSLEVYWRDLTTPGPFVNRNLGLTDGLAPQDFPKTGYGNHGLLAAHLSLKPGQTRQVRFVIAWNFPVCENYWDEKAADKAKTNGVSPFWRNYYSMVWKDSAASAAYAFANWQRLLDETTMFRDALFGSSLPPVVLEAVSSNISVLKSPTVMRLEDGTFYGFEGVHHNWGSCEGTCTHVWNYQQALPFLFPRLERRVREVDYRYNQQPNGGMPFRLQLPLGIKHPGGRSCADGLFGNVMAVYRDWKISGDGEWLRSLWPYVKKSIEFAWDPTNEDAWDPDQTGVLWGRQHHTLDVELFGPSSWLCGFYLGALKAAAEMAKYLCDGKAAGLCHSLFVKGQAWINENLFNGEYYHQIIDVKDKRVVEKFTCADTYWDGEHGEIKYQIGEGCEIDQVLAQYHANLYGLGEIFDPGKTRTALRSIFRNNFVRRIRDAYNPWRLYALNDESGLIICSWPRGKRKPAIPLTYAQEAMHGFEYAAAVQMIQHGMIKEGLAVVKGVRDRYDGEKRNPWNEIECGSNYARSMASYALLNAFSGFRFDLTKGMIGFNPVMLTQGRFRTFWSLGGAWGEFEVGRGAVVLSVRWGEVTLSVLELPFLKAGESYTMTMAGRRVHGDVAGGSVVFAKQINLRKGSLLELRTAKKRRATALERESCPRHECARSRQQ